jgi:hypothetical protein
MSKAVTSATGDRSSTMDVEAPPRRSGDDPLRSPYPITITPARYGGVYEDGEWLAFHLSPKDIPEEAFGDDRTCAAWWGDHGDGVGKGGTPQEAYENLLAIDRPLQRVRTRDDWTGRLERAAWRDSSHTGS